MLSLVCTNVLAVLVDVLVAMLAVLNCYSVSVFYISWLFCVLTEIRTWTKLRFTIIKDTLSAIIREKVGSESTCWLVDSLS